MISACPTATMTTLDRATTYRINQKRNSQPRPCATPIIELTNVSLSLRTQRFTGIDTHRRLNMSGFDGAGTGKLIMITASATGISRRLMGHVAADPKRRKCGDLNPSFTRLHSCIQYY